MSESRVSDRSRAEKRAPGDAHDDDDLSAPIRVPMMLMIACWLGGLQVGFCCLIHSVPEALLPAHLAA